MVQFVDASVSQTPEAGKKQKTDFNKLQTRIRRDLGRASADFNMIKEGDRNMVCLSGCHDS